MTRPRLREILERAPGPEVLTLSGWVKTKREGKTAVFLELNDGSSPRSLQLVVDPSQPALAALLGQITTGAALRAQGPLVPSPAPGQPVELAVQTLELLGAAPAETYPLQKKRHSMEFLRQIAHLRPRTNTFAALARVRDTLSQEIHAFFRSEGFFYVHTPLITGSDAEGAGQMFQVTTLPLEGPPRTETGAIDYSRDFFGKKTHLTVSGQLNGEAYALALGRIYTFGPTFRAENSNTTRHLAEFWMIEPEAAFFELKDNMDLAEAFLKHLVGAVMTRHGEEMAFFDQWVQPGLVDTLKSLLDRPFARLSYTEAVERLQASGRTFEFPVHWGMDLQSEHEKYLTDEVYRGPVIVTDYPKEIKAFYMKQNADGRTVRAMDVLVPRLGEIIGGSQREEDLGRLERRLVELGLNPQDYAWYLDLRRFGSAPHSGFGLGFERLVQYVTGMGNIRDVIPFPRAKDLAEF